MPDETQRSRKSVSSDLCFVSTDTREIADLLVREVEDR